MKDLKKVKEIILQTYKYTAEFCRKHNLRFYACGGTMLGAVRHNDIIPWDDDIDLYMPREDYDKLLSLRNEMKGTGYDIVSLNDKGYYLPFAKVVNINTTIWEYPEYEFIIGEFVDIFPLDNFNCCDKQIIELQKRMSYDFINYKFSIRSDKFKLLKHLFLRFKLKTILRLIIYGFILNNSEKNAKKIMNIHRKYTEKEGKKCVCISQWQGKIFKREWFDDCIDIPFADTTIPVPRKYDEYLKLLYGNYMELPPLEKRISIHRIIYRNLEKGLTLEEVKDIIGSKNIPL